MCKYLCTALLFVFVTAASAQAQPGSSRDSIDYYEMSIEQLMKIKAHGLPSELEKLINELIAAASKKPLNTRESPAIVSLITEEEIRKSGARDLIDVLRLVPGIDFGVDVEGVVGIGMRGNWAHEGKVLLLIDGQEMNEVLFATTQFGNHYPIGLIQRIEVIRGPGSAIYGGFAEYGVINIITKSASDLSGGMLDFTNGFYSSTLARQNLNIGLGDHKGDLKYSVTGQIGRSSRSDQRYTDLTGNSFWMAGQSSLDPGFVNAAISYKGLSVRGIFDDFRTSMRDGYGDVLPDGAVNERFSSAFTEVKYALRTGPSLTITPKFTYKKQTPWQSDEYEGKDAYDKTASRALGNITMVYNVSRHFNVVAGGEFYEDAAHDRVDSSYFTEGGKRVFYHNYAFFAQGLLKTRPVNVILGARYDRHNIYGDAFVPRVGLTKKYNRFHFKALYSGAFRAPSIENINYMTDDGIRPELTRVAELELGYQLSRKSILTVNVFDITTNNPIVYLTDSANNDIYTNYGSGGSQGIEAEYRLRGKEGYLTVNYAFYTVSNKDRVEDYKVAEHWNTLLAFANHKLNINASRSLTKNLSINPSLSFIGERWGYHFDADSAAAVLKSFKPVILANLFVWYESPVKGLQFGAGVYDLFDQRFHFIQPYNGGHAPLPGPSREILLRLRYVFQSKKSSP